MHKNDITDLLNLQGVIVKKQKISKDSDIGCLIITDINKENVQAYYKENDYLIKNPCNNINIPNKYNTILQIIRMKIFMYLQKKK